MSDTQSNDVTPPVDLLRARAALEGVHPTDEDLEAVRSFLSTILPALADLEQRLPEDAVIAALYLPEPEGQA
ncbi:MAG: hypothetical protein ACKVUT_11565 [Gaiella sp.]